MANPQVPARRRFLPAALLPALLAAGCITGYIPAPVPDPVSPSSFQAGAAVADLTPIPGIPMGGYSLGGKVSRGFWTRLRARAIYLEDANGQAFVLVACDLDQIPNGLADRVADLVRDRIAHLGRGQIVLGASHTHHGPGSFFSSRMYNAMASPRPGFDKELFEFLARRIAGAVEDAYDSRRDALLRTPSPQAVAAPISCLFRNRSLEAFERNDDAAAFPGIGGPLPCPARCAVPKQCRMVDPRLDFFEVVAAADPSQAIAVAGFFASHATVLTPDNELYSADLFGAAATLLEQGRPGCPAWSERPVVALFNGPEGDVSPAWEPQGRDRTDLLQLAGKLADGLCARLPGAPAQLAPRIGWRFGVVEPLADRTVSDPWSRRPGAIQRTAREPRAGVAALGGAEDGRSFLYEMGMREGVRGPVRNDHGPKHTFELELAGIPTSLAKIVNNQSPPPKRAPVGVYRLGPLVLVTLPGEFTTMMGRRIREHVLAQLPPGSTSQVILVGLAGGHVSYVTTPEEYEAQHYEGAQNLYGAATGPLMGAELGAMAAQLDSGSTVAPRSYSYYPGKVRHWEPREVAETPYEMDRGLDAVVQDLATRQPKHDFPTFCFRDAVPRLSQVGGACRRAVPDVRIEAAASGAPLVVGAAPQDNRGLDLVTVLHGVSRHATEWCAVWLVPAATPPAAGYRFRVEPVTGDAGDPLDDLTSSAFTLPAGPAAPPTAPLEADRPAGILCWPSMKWLGLCPSQTCQAPT